MFLTVLEFAMVTLGVKLALGLVLIYYLFPADGRCPDCDGETLPLRARAGLRRLGRALRLERRWCMQCGRTMLARRGRGVVAQPAAAPESQRRKAA